MSPRARWSSPLGGFSGDDPAPRPAEEEGFFAEPRAGFGFLAGARVLLVVVVGAYLRHPDGERRDPRRGLSPRETFSAGNLGYGLLASFWGGGMVLGALAGVLDDRTYLLLLYFLSIFATALALAVAGLLILLMLAAPAGKRPQKNGA